MGNRLGYYRVGSVRRCSGTDLSFADYVSRDALGVKLGHRRVNDPWRGPTARNGG